MAQPLLPMFPSDVTEINPLMSCAKREGPVYYFNGPMPMFSHAESDRASFAMFASQMVVNGNCRQAEIVRALGISAISVKRHVKRYRQFPEYEVSLPHGEKQRMKLAERGVWLGKKLWVREIRRFSSDGHQTAVISTDSQSDLGQIARQMFSRWAQENWFKYMIEHFGLESLMTYQLEPVSETTRVVNPAARTLGAQIKSKAAQLSRRQAEYEAQALAGLLEVGVAEEYQSRQTQFSRHQTANGIQIGVRLKSGGCRVLRLPKKRGPVKAII